MDMTNAFYIVQVREDWYRLHVTSTHYCLGACGDVQALLNTVVRLTKKYKTVKGLNTALSKMEDKGRVNETTYVQYEKDYNELTPLWSGTVKSTVTKALEEVRSNSPIFKSFKSARTKKRLAVVTEPPVENNPKPMTVRKPKMLLAHR